MSEKIRIAIVGYGNLGRGVEQQINLCNDMELVAIFSRRKIESKTGCPVYEMEKMKEFKKQVDVAILCGGSATDLPQQGPQVAKFFNTVDSFDTHAKIKDYLKSMNISSLNSEKVSIISVGWDPGLFSISRLYMESILPDGSTYTFWGPGVSQGHSDAIRRISGVIDAVQYTIPKDESIELVRKGTNPELLPIDKHFRLCYVVAEDSANKEIIENEIVNMPNYFDEYETEVHFISKEELQTNHKKMPHGGFVIRSGKTGDEKQVMEFSLKLESNPLFTASVLLAYARAAYRLHEEKKYGAKTVLDIPPVLLSEKPYEEHLKNIL